jgi:O-acetyl-ADP-ribose deacetylase
MPFQIVHNDITKMKTDAIVNAANSRLQYGGGVCGAIFDAAGKEQLQLECNKKAPCPVGHACLTDGYQLPAKYIIHAVGPIYKDGMHKERTLLLSAYQNSLKLAKEYHCKSISFPLISSGIYGYPKEEALQVAIQAISEYLLHNDMDVYLVVFDRKAVYLSEKLFSDITHYIDSYYTDTKRRSISRRLEAQNQLFDDSDRIKSLDESIPHYTLDAIPNREDERKLSTTKKRKLESLLTHMDETFSEMLIRIIDEKGFTDVEVYKRANMDRKLFSKIRSNKDYNPKKQTVIALAIALKLSVDEAKDLLQKAGYSLSNSHKFDVIIRYFLEKREYNIFIINEALFCFEQPTIGL